MLSVKNIKPKVQFILREHNDCPFLLQGIFRYSLNGEYFYVIVNTWIKLYGNLQYEGVAIPTNVGDAIFKEADTNEYCIISAYCIGNFLDILNNDELDKMIADYENRVKRAKKYQREVAKDVLRGKIFSLNSNETTKGEINE